MKGGKNNQDEQPKNKGEGKQKAREYLTQRERRLKRFRREKIIIIEEILIIKY